MREFKDLKIAVAGTGYVGYHNGEYSAYYGRVR